LTNNGAHDNLFRMEQHSKLPQQASVVDDELWRPSRVNRETGIALGTLAYWRSVGTGPKFGKLGKNVVYRRSDLEQWLNAQFQC